MPSTVTSMLRRAVADRADPEPEVEEARIAGRNHDVLRNRRRLRRFRRAAEPCPERRRHADTAVPPPSPQPVLAERGAEVVRRAGPSPGSCTGTGAGRRSLRSPYPGAAAPANRCQPVANVTSAVASAGLLPRSVSSAAGGDRVRVAAVRRRRHRHGDRARAARRNLRAARQA